MFGVVVEAARAFLLCLLSLSEFFLSSSNWAAGLSSLSEFFLSSSNWAAAW